MRDVPELSTGSRAIHARKKSTAEVAVERSVSDAPPTMSPAAHFFWDPLNRGAVQLSVMS